MNLSNSAGVRQRPFSYEFAVRGRVSAVLLSAGEAAAKHPQKTKCGVCSLETGMDLKALCELGVPC